MEGCNDAAGVVMVAAAAAAHRGALSSALVLVTR